ncbi:hypothetical protein ROJ8625_00450 [Roseivivax jejudonensis]|uniref:Uncharacterized protein n=1 Tax=Roseivivax jejudonensis TaxID=1529041 RepID=A0A1X6Y9B7_9RHOB|nr:hypothetical protein ROJ8625_00450 [Roseivivax jejudonensis]
MHPVIVSFLMLASVAGMFGLSGALIAFAARRTAVRPAPGDRPASQV